MNKSKSPITTVIFDMDGVLINSEPLWKATEIEVFAELGLDFEAIGGEKTVGMRIDEVIAYWYDPNIQPQAEEEKRFQAFVKVCEIEGVKYIRGEYDVKNFFKKIK